MKAPANKIKIVVADDNSFVRAGLISLINRQKDLACCGEASSLASTPPVVAACKPDLVLLDLRFQDGESFELMHSLKLRFPSVTILVLSQCDEMMCAERALQAGAKGYIMKQEAVEELLNAIRIVAGGGVYLSGPMAVRLAQKSPLHEGSTPYVPPP